jgi:hypothetical protein
VKVSVHNKQGFHRAQDLNCTICICDDISCPMNVSAVFWDFFIIYGWKSFKLWVIWFVSWVITLTYNQFQLRKVLYHDPYQEVLSYCETGIFKLHNNDTFCCCKGYIVVICINIRKTIYGFYAGTCSSLCVLTFIFFCRKQS